MRLPLASLRVGQQRCVNLNSATVVVCRTESGVFAIENRCPHADSPLFGGTLAGDTIRCPVHGAKFDLKSGESITNRRLEPVRTFTVAVDGDSVTISDPENQG